MTVLEHVADDRGRVTAGLPSLSSERRHDITEFHLKQIYQRTLASEYRGNEQRALAPDGAIEDTTDIEQVAGIPLTGARIINRLRKLNPNLWFEPSISDRSKTGVYVIDPILGKQHICGMETDWNPEFTLRVVDNKGNAKGIIGGWRRVLTRLIRARLVSEARASAVFGPPSRDSENWARYTQ